MACYLVPLAAAAGTFLLRRSRPGGARGFWLNIMLLGGALFGLIDHAWNAELMLISANWMSDLALGFTITAGITGAWGVISYWDRMRLPLRHMTRRMGFLSR